MRVSYFGTFRLCETLCVGVCEGVLRTALNFMNLLPQQPVCVICAYHIGVNLMVRSHACAHYQGLTVMLRWPVCAITACDSQVMSLLTSACDNLVKV